jgi:hypothetical protein
MSPGPLELGADALRFVLAQGLPAVIAVSGRSMEPTLALGAKVDVAALGEGDRCEVGDVVLVATSGDGLLLHRVMTVFVEGGEGFVVHQGDAPDSTFGIAARRDVLARMAGFAGDTRPPPTPAILDAEARARFWRRRLACEGFVGARRFAHALHLTDRVLARTVVRRCAQAYRKLARTISG